MDNWAKARSEDDYLVHGASIKILFITPACTDSILSANLTDFILMSTARICRSDKKSGKLEYEMRSGTKIMKRKAQMCIGIWSSYSNPSSRQVSKWNNLSLSLLIQLNVTSRRYGPNPSPFHLAIHLGVSLAVF